jgi:hypothetical protein
MQEADRVHSTPPLNSSPIQEANPPQDVRAESVDSFSPQPAIGQRKSECRVSESRKPAERLSNIVEFPAQRTHDGGVPIGEPVPNDYFTHLFSMSFFQLPFVTLPQDPGDCWGEFWKRVDMWNDKPTDNSCTDYHRGRKYAVAAVEALVTERVSTRQLEIVVERMIEGAFRQRGPKGKLLPRAFICGARLSRLMGFARSP